MSEVEDLIRRLHEDADRWMSGDVGRDNEDAGRLSYDAATALANLTAERDEARERYSTVVRQRHELLAQRDALQARVGELEAGLRDTVQIASVTIRLDRDRLQELGRSTMQADAALAQIEAAATLLKGPNNVG